MPTCTRCGTNYGFMSGKGLCTTCAPMVRAEIDGAAPKPPDELGDMLNAGWTIVGYSTATFTVGVIAHSILLQRGIELRSVTIQKFGDKDVSRTTHQLAG